MVQVSQRRVCGFSTSFLLLAIGIASLVVSVPDRNNNTIPNCGSSGSPPLRDYLFGTGIAYIIIAVSFTVTSIFTGFAALFSVILACSNCFVFAWMIVGAVSLWRDGSNCQAINYPVWAMGMAAVIVSIIIVATGGYTNYRTKRDEND